MRIAILLFLFTFSSLSLYTQQIHIEEFIVVNLEEDKGPFATLNDEILLIQGAKNIAKDSIMWWQYSDIAILSDSLPRFTNPFPLSLAVDSNTNWLFLIIEIDSRISAADMSDKVRSVFEEYSAFPANLLKEKIRLQMEDDDLLGFYYLSPRQRNKLDGQIKLKGMHMFNRYEYEIHLSFK